MKFENILEAVLEGKEFEEVKPMVDELIEEMMNETHYTVELDKEHETLTVKTLHNFTIEATTVPLGKIEGIEFGDEEMTIHTEMGTELFVEGPAEELIDLATEVGFAVVSSKGLI